VGANLLMIVHMFGSSLTQDWIAAETQLMYALVFSVLLFLLRHNVWSIGYLNGTSRELIFCTFTICL
jgi:thiosulfate dehydrogenase (quinone) large subunit